MAERTAQERESMQAMEQAAEMALHDCTDEVQKEKERTTEIGKRQPMTLAKEDIAKKMGPPMATVSSIIVAAAPNLSRSEARPIELSGPGAFSMPGTDTLPQEEGQEEALEVFATPEDPNISDTGAHRTEGAPPLLAAKLVSDKDDHILVQASPATPEKVDAQMGHPNQRLRVLLFAVVVLAGALAAVIVLAMGSDGSGDTTNSTAAASLFPPIDFEEFSTKEETIQFVLEEYLTTKSWATINKARIEANTLGLSDDPVVDAYDWIVQDAAIDDIFIVQDEHAFIHRVLQRFVLASFFFGMDGENWFDNDRWLEGVHECEWWSLMGPLEACDDDLNYAALDYPKNNVTGTLPEDLHVLPKLLIINLEENSLFGTIPSTLVQLTKLAHLILPNMALSGTLPTELLSLPDLEEVALDLNQLEGPLPTQVNDSSPLHGLFLGGNSGITGTVPESWSQLRLLAVVTLYGTSLSGTVPASVCEASEQRGTEYVVDLDTVECSCCPDFSRRL